ncbi:MAG: transposase [Opitutales bacterium]|nr:transposase [Opitutales bacterium]
MKYNQRITLDGENPEPAGFHCTARVMRQANLLDEEAREMLVRMIHRLAGFCGVEVLTYCILPNHFHVLVRVDPKARDCGDEALIHRFRALYGKKPASGIGVDAEGFERLLADPKRAAKADEIRGKLRARMGDVSAYMQSLTQRYTKWFNATRGGGGTLWAERFRSVMVEDAAGPLRVIAAYIDLNPVRAGLAADPKDYRWCGHAAAVTGESAERAACCRRLFPAAKSEAKALADYRLYLLGSGEPRKHGKKEASAAAEGEPEAQSDDERLPAHALLRRRIPHFTYGVAIGSAAFIENILNRPDALGFRRERAPKPVPTPANEETIFCARQWMHPSTTERGDAAAYRP